MANEEEFERIKTLIDPNLAEAYRREIHYEFAVISQPAIQGMTLAEFRELAIDKKINCGQLASIAAEVLGAIGKLHRLGIYNLGISEHLFIRFRPRKGQPARWVFAGAGLGALTPPSLSSPERLQCREATAASNTYELSALFFSLLAGKPPFPGNSNESMILAGPWSGACDYEGVPYPVDLVFRQALSVDARERFQSVGALNGGDPMGGGSGGAARLLRARPGLLPGHPPRPAQVPKKLFPVAPAE